jgi:hypothetical protein
MAMRSASVVASTLVVGDVDDGGATAALQALELDAQFLAQLASSDDSGSSIR